MDHEFPYLSLLLITGLAAVLPLLTPWLSGLRIPLVVVEMVAGMIIGHSGLNLIETGPSLEFLATFGFTYLMFLSGLEMDYGTIGLSLSDRNRMWRLDNPLTLGLVTFGLTLVGGLLTAYVLQRIGLVEHPIIMALILSTTSLGIAVPVLKERALMETPYGQSLLISAVVADFGTMLLITTVTAAISRGLKLDVLLVLLLLAGFAVAVRLGHLATRMTRLQHMVEDLSHATTQLKVRATFALLLAFIALARLLGTEIILGAFLAGAVIAILTREEHSLLHQQMDAIGYGFFIPLFFIMVGVQFDLMALLKTPEAWVLIVLLLGCAFGVKLAASLVYRRVFSWRETIAAGVLLSARLSLIIAVAAIALELGAINAAMHAAIVFLAMLTCTLAPILFSYVIPPQEDARRRGVLLVGLGQLSALLAERLRQTDEAVTLVGLDTVRANELQQRGFPVIQGDPTKTEILHQAGAEKAAALIAVSSQEEHNFKACSLGRDYFGIPNLIALVHDPDLAARMSEQHIRVVQPQLATVLALEGAWHFPATFDILANPPDGVIVREGVLNNPRLHGLPLRHIRLPGDVLILGLRRSGEALVPRGDTVLELGDVLMLVGRQEGVQQAIAWLVGYHTEALWL